MLVGQHRRAAARFDGTMVGGVDIVRVLDVDPDLGEGLEPGVARLLHRSLCRDGGRADLAKW